MDDNIPQFRGVMCSHGLQPPEYIEPGKLHRFPGQGKRRGNRAGWCVFFYDGVGGSFGDWSTGLNENWQAQHERPCTTDDRADIKRQIEAARNKEKAERAVKHSKAAGIAEAVTKSSKPALFHPYLKAKKVLPLGILENDKFLVIPMQDIDRKIWSVQNIAPGGKKLFMPGGRITDCFYLIGEPITDRVFICEGFATGATLHMYGKNIGAYRQPVVVTFNAGNLKPVAQAIRTRYPSAAITIAADNDVNTDGNPGLSKAKEAAALVGGRVLWPNFEKLPGGGTDFNDYMLIGGRL